MDLEKLSERDICTKIINPSLQKAGWDLQRQIREEFPFTDGRVILQGSFVGRGKRRRADYILFYKPNIPLAIIEAKSAKYSAQAGMQQGLSYAETLDIPFVFSTNGRAFIFHDRKKSTSPKEVRLTTTEFPSPETLWELYLSYTECTQPERKAIVEQDYPVDEEDKSPRYYQQIAINRTIEAVAKGQKRIILVMATGTGKTYTAFNILWRLWKAKVAKRILFLADRTALLSQTKNNDFAPFGSDIMHIIKHRVIDKSYQIYFALYQGLTGKEETKNVYKEFSEDFFDLIVIDECHRGSAAEASEWHDILTYFSSAIQIGLTATPKETKDVSNMAYFGEPIYTYSLKQGIDDGFLAPYKVIRVQTTVDEGWRPTAGLVDYYGNEVADRIYNLKDYDRNLVIDERTQLVAQKISEYLKGYDRLAKTIVFCVDIDHADRMRQALINENADMVAKHPNYVVKITGDDEYGKMELDNFKSVDEPFPVIATTSKMLTTGIDTKMVKLIVLDANIGSMTDFKQIVGRGTRLRYDDGKVFFTVMDFRKATNHFADPAFDDDPIQIYEPQPGETVIPPDIEGDSDQGTVYPEGEPESDTFSGVSEPPVDWGFGEEPVEVKKFYVNGVDVEVIHERVQYYGPGGKLITESLRDYTRKNMEREFSSLDQFLLRWNEADKKEELVGELRENGVFLELLQAEVGLDLDPFDLICHVAFDRPPLTRKERANEVRKRDYFERYGEDARKVLNILLDRYAELGEIPHDAKVLRLSPFSEMGTAKELVKAFGEKEDFFKALDDLEQEIYKTA